MADSKLRFCMFCNKSTRYKGCFSVEVSGEQRIKHITVGVCYVHHNRQRVHIFYFTSSLILGAAAPNVSTRPYITISRYLFDNFLLYTAEH